MLRCSILVIGNREPHFPHVQPKKGYGENICLILAFRVLPLHSSFAQGHSTAQRTRCLEAIQYLIESLVPKVQDLKCLHRQEGNALQFALQTKFFHLSHGIPAPNHLPVCCRRYAAVTRGFVRSEMSRDQKGAGEGCGFREAILSSASSSE